MLYFFSVVTTVIGWFVLSFLLISLSFTAIAWIFFWKDEKYKAKEKNLPRVEYALEVGFANLWMWLLDLTTYALVNRTIRNRLEKGHDEKRIADELGLAPATVRDRMSTPLFAEFRMSDIFSSSY